MGFAEIENLSLTVEVEQPLGDGGIVTWQMGNGTTWSDLAPINDPTQNFSQTGNHQIEFGRITAIPIGAVNQIENRWLRCHLITPIIRALEPQTGMVRVSQLPKLKRINLQTRLNRTGLAIATAFTNQIPVDLSKDFFPFGQRPKFGDTLYLANGEVFSIAGAAISLHIELTNPTGIQNSPIPATQASEGLQLQFEFWNGQTWVNLNASSEPDPDARRFTQSGIVQFTLPADNPPVATTVNGVENFWIRVRIVAGNYGQEVRYELLTTEDGRPRIENDEPLYRRIPEDSFAPPSIRSLRVDYSLSATAQPEAILTYNDFVYSDNLTPILRAEEESFAPFQLEPNTLNQPTVYFGFTLPPNRSLFPNRPLSLFSRIVDIKYGEKLVPLSPNRSQGFGVPEAQVEHEFTITNAASETVNLQIEFLGTRWFTELTTPVTIRLNAKEEETVRVRVTIPENTALDSRDRGFLQVISSDTPFTIHTAVFETVVATEPPDDENPRLIWEYFNGQNWQQLIVRDETEAFVRGGLVEFIAPKDIYPSKEFGLAPQYWLRVQWERGNYAVEPRWQRVLLNTTIARQSVTFRDEILGSSDGTANKIFRTIHSPVLTGQQLEVQEPELPSRNELGIEESAIISLPITTGQSREIWMPWQEVTDFYASTPRDRHYVPNLPTTMPINLPNLDDRTYQDLVAEALSLIPTYAPEWTNHNPSDPGITLIELFAYLSEMLIYRQNRITDANVRMFLKLLNDPTWKPSEDLREDIRQTVLRVRERYRAVTCQDFEELAITATSDVARAHCLPRRNLESDNPLADAPAQISIIILPQETARDRAADNLQPSEELLQAVKNYLEPRRLLTTKVHVVKPRYLAVGVRLKLRLVRDALEGQVRSSAVAALERFLHPLTGGSDGQGWQFGRSIYVSEIYQLLDNLPGVDYVVKVVRDGEQLDELTLSLSDANRLIRNRDDELVAVALQPDELVTAQSDPNAIALDSPVEPLELPSVNT